MAARLNTRANNQANSASDTLVKRIAEPHVRSSEYILRKFRGKPPSLTIHLHATFFRFDQQDGSFPYDSPMKFILQHLRKQTIPHEMVQDLLENRVAFYDGCLIVNVVNHKSSVAKTPAPGNLSSVKQQDGLKDQAHTGPRTSTVVLHPTDLSRHHELMHLANQQSKGALVDETNYYQFEATMLISSEPPLLLDPAKTFEEAEMALSLLKHPLHSEAPPSPRSRKRTHAEMALDDAQAFEEERRMLIMDERTKPSLRGANGTSASEGQTASVALGFSRFKTLETIKKNHEENDRKKKEEEAQKAIEKRQHDAALAQKRKLMEDRNRQEQAATQQQQKQKMMMHQQQQQLMQQQAVQQQQAAQLQQQQQQQLQQQQQQQLQQQQQHAHNLAQAQTPMATNPQQQHLQQAAMAAQHSSPIVHNPTPIMASSPVMPNASNMNMGGFPMQTTASNQGAGSPARPPSAAMQHANIAMARQLSQQANPSRHATPQMAHGTPQMASAVPMDGNRQMSGTPNMQHRSPIPPHMQGTPNQAGLMAGTPQMNGINQMNQMNQLTPTQQMAIMQQQRARLQQQTMQASPGQYTPEQLTVMRNQQNMALQQQMNPQMYAQMQQRIQMQNMQGGTPMMQTPSQQQQQQQMNQAMSQQMGQSMPNAQAAQRAQAAGQARAQFMRTKQMIVTLQSQGQPIPIELQHRFQQQQQMVHAAQQQMAVATARTQQATLGDTNNTEQYMQNLRNQQALIARLQRTPQMGQQAGMMNGGGQQQQNMNMLQTQQAQMQQMQFARQVAMNQQRPGSGMGQ
ncbi:unnamed protein product [Aureobasidium pullulans]|nr:unnamed protein product [Aureobasidium pullulans]